MNQIASLFFLLCFTCNALRLPPSELDNEWSASTSSVSAIQTRQGIENLRSRTDEAVYIEEDFMHIFPNELTTFTPLAFEKQMRSQKDDGHDMLFVPGKADIPMRTRPVTNHGKCRNDFFILGTRKGGTTSLYHYITRHPDVKAINIHGGPQDGEVFKHLGSQEHKKVFAHVPKDKVVGESTVSRLQDDAHGLSKYCSGARLLALLRDPVSRCHSEMLMRVRLGTNKYSNISNVLLKHTLAFKKYVDTHPELVHISDPPVPQNPEFRSAGNCLYEGAYVIHLRRLLAAGVPKDDLRLYRSDDFFARPEQIVKDALSFIGLNRTIWDASTAKKVYNGRRSETLTPATWLEPGVESLMRTVMQPFNAELSQFLTGQSSSWWQ